MRQAASRSERSRREIVATEFATRKPSDQFTGSISRRPWLVIKPVLRPIGGISYQSVAHSGACILRFEARRGSRLITASVAVECSFLSRGVRSGIVGKMATEDIDRAKVGTRISSLMHAAPRRDRRGFVKQPRLACVSRHPPIPCLVRVDMHSYLMNRPGNV